MSKCLRERYQGRTDRQTGDKERKRERERGRKSVVGKSWFDYLGEPHGREPAGAGFFTVKSNDLEPGFSRVDGGGVGLVDDDDDVGGGVGGLAAARPQANAPGERRPVPLPRVRDLVHRVVRQVDQRARLPALLQSKSKAQRSASQGRSTPPA